MWSLQKIVFRADSGIDLKGYDTRNEQLQALHTREIDLIFHVSQNPYSAETNGFVLSDTIWTFNMAATTAKDSFNENAENTVAVTKDNFALKRTFKICALERPDGKTIPIIAMTSQCLCGRYAKCLDAGMNAYLAKPLEVQKVISVIAQGCNNS